MCDYSLGGIQNRLARDGEALQLFRFPTGSMGMADPAEIQRAREWAQEKRGFWRTLFGRGRRPEVCAVCIPPGARLKVFGFNLRTQSKFGIGEAAEVTFLQVDFAESNRHRDAIRFDNGGWISLQELMDGQPVRVVCLDLLETRLAREAARTAQR